MTSSLFWRQPVTWTLDLREREGSTVRAYDQKVRELYAKCHADLVQDLLLVRGHDFFEPCDLAPMGHALLAIEPLVLVGVVLLY